VERRVAELRDANRREAAAAAEEAAAQRRSYDALREHARQLAEALAVAEARLEAEAVATPSSNRLRSQVDSPAAAISCHPDGTVARAQSRQPDLQPRPAMPAQRSGAVMAVLDDALAAAALVPAQPRGPLATVVPPGPGAAPGLRAGTPRRGSVEAPPTPGSPPAEPHRQPSVLAAREEAVQGAAALTTAARADIDAFGGQPGHFAMRQSGLSHGDEMPAWKNSKVQETNAEGILLQPEPRDQGSPRVDLLALECEWIARGGETEAGTVVGSWRG